MLKCTFNINCSLRSDKNCKTDLKINAILIWTTTKTNQCALLWHFAAVRLLSRAGQAGGWGKRVRGFVMGV